MSWYYYRNTGAEKAMVLLEISKRRKKGEPFVAEKAATPRGAMALTFWGRAWCENLESYADYEHRLPRGRTYLRGGKVFDLEVATGYVFAYVAGSSLYEVEVRIDPLASARWKKLCGSLAGEVGHLVDLLAGRLGPGVMAAVTAPKTGIFPAPGEIHINCSCPDWATLCKHAAATLYAIGARLDHDPGLLFTLRGVDPAELVAAASSGVARLATQAPATANTLDPDGLAELFGIDLAEPEAAFAAGPEDNGRARPEPGPKPKRKTRPRPGAKRKRRG